MSVNFPLTTTSLFVNTLTTNKIIYLPAASTVNAGRLFYIKDICGNAARSSIYISTTGMDRIENRSSAFALMSTNYGSILMAPDGYLNWYFLQHYYKNAVSSLGAKVAVAATISFTPVSIIGLKMWFDATDATTLTLSAGNVTQWTDKSGTGNTLTPWTGQANATVSSAYQNGLNVLNFSGNSLYRSPLGSAVYPQDVYIILAMKSVSAHNDVLGMGDTQSDNFNSLTFGEYTARRWHNGSSGFNRTPNCVSPSDETSTSFLLIQWSIANSNFLIRRNGTQLVQTASYTYSFGTPSTSIFQIGYRHANVTGTANFNGYIGEILLFNSQLGTTDRQTVEGYLAWRWGIQSSLPSGHPYFNSAPTATTFTPASIAGLAVWLDASDSTTLNISAGNITSWTDKSGNGRTATSSGNPTLNSNQVVFSGSQYFSGSISNTTANLTAFVVAKTTTSPATASSRILSASAGGLDYDNTASMDVIVYLDTSNTLGSFRNYVTLSTATTTPNQTFIAVTRTNSTTNTFYLNGTASSTVTLSGGAVGSFGYTTYWVGSGPSGAAITGTVSEVLYFHTDLTTAQRQQVEGYLAAKWGLQSSLPTGHPYKSSAPTSAIGTPIATSLRYQFDAAKNLPTTSGWTDANGYGNLTFYNSPTVTTGNVNYVSFNGTSQYGASVDMTGLTAFTITMWIRTTSTTDNATQYQKPNIIGQSSMNDASQDFIVTIGGGYAGVYSGIGSTDAYNQAQGGTSTANYIANNAWHEITVTSSYTNGTRLYVDGTQFGSSLPASKTTQSGQNWYIGAGNWMGGGANWWAALDLSVVLLYTRELSATEVTANFNSYRSRFIVTQSTITPASITGLSLWLDGSDSTTITTATGVSQWNDKSGNGYNLTQSTGASQPTRTGNYLNFQSSYYLNVPFSAMNNLSTWSIFLLINPISASNWIMVKQKDGANTYNVISMTYNTSGGGSSQTGTSGYLYWRSYNAGSQAASANALSTSTVQIFNIIYDGTNLYIYINGTLNSTTAGSFAIQNDTSPTNYTLGCWIQSGSQINSGVTNFKLGELMCYSASLSTTNRQKLEGYLAWKWGIQSSLSSGHPYFGAPP